METRFIKTFLISLSSIGFSFLLFLSILGTLGWNFQVVLAQDTNNPCPQTTTMGATYVDKQGCIQPCPTSNEQESIPEECPQQQTGQQQQLPQQQTGQQQQLPQQQTGQQQQPQLLQTLQPSDQIPRPQTPQQQNQNTPPNNNNLVTSSCHNDLSGVWQANDGGTYYIKQDGNKIVWWGSNIFNGGIGANPIIDYDNQSPAIYTIINSFSNTAKGNLSADGNTITAEWQDSILISYFFNHGEITLSVDPSGTKLVKVSSTGGFGGSEWTRECNNQ